MDRIDVAVYFEERLQRAMDMDFETIEFPGVDEEADTILGSFQGLGNTLSIVHAALTARSGVAKLIAQCVERSEHRLYLSQVYYALAEKAVRELAAETHDCVMYILEDTELVPVGYLDEKVKMVDEHGGDEEAAQEAAEAIFKASDAPHLPNEVVVDPPDEETMIACVASLIDERMKDVIGSAWSDGKDDDDALLRYLQKRIKKS